MRVRMKVRIGGTRDGERWPSIGAEFVVPDAEGADLCAQGYAEPVVERATPERRPAKRAETRKG